MKNGKGWVKKTALLIEVDFLKKSSFHLVVNLAIHNFG